MAAEEQWVRFKIGDVFPANSLVARFVIGLAMLQNDLVASNAEILRRGGVTDVDYSPEVASLFWDAASQLREAAKFIADAVTEPEVQAFIASLPEEAQGAVNDIIAACTPWEGSFVHAVTKPIRDNRLHYPKLSDPAWNEALERSADSPSGIRMRGPTVGDARAVFADEVRGRLLIRHLGETIEDIRESMKRVANLCGQTVRLSQIAFTEYLLRLPEGTYDTSDLDGIDTDVASGSDGRP